MDFLFLVKKGNFYQLSFANTTQTTIGWDYQLWLGNTPPIVRIGQISLVIWGVYSALFQSRRGGRAPSQHLRDSDDSTQPPTQLLSFTNPPLLVSWVHALFLLSPSLFLHPDLLFGDRRCMVFRPGLSFLFSGAKGDTWSTTHKKQQLLIMRGLNFYVWKNSMYWTIADTCILLWYLELQVCLEFDWTLKHK